MTYQEQISEINILTLQGHLAEAQERLHQLSPGTTAQSRQREHFLAIVAIRRGAFAQALEILDSAEKNFGPNVNLLRERMIVQYHLQDMSGFRANLLEFERTLREREYELSPRTLLEGELMLGKFLEEEAHLARAHEFYERAEKRCEIPAHRLRLLIQKTRWLALYCSQHETLSASYRQLISVSRDGLTKDLEVELEHSLMLIEMRLVGGDHAWQRYARITDSLNPTDQRLLFFDFIEGALTNDFEINSEVLEKMRSFQNLDSFERLLARLAQGDLPSPVMIHELAVLATQAPWACYLRLLCLASNLSANASMRLELNRKIQLIVRDLDPQSQKLWNQRVKHILQSPEIRVEYSPRLRSVSIQGRSVDLSKKKMGQQLLEGLAQKTELTVDEAITLLWQASFSPEHYHRLRMGIHRLNTLINKVTGMGKIIEVDSQTVRLRPEVKLRRADDISI